MVNDLNQSTQAERLKTLATRLKITTRDLAKIINVSENAVYKMSSGIMKISDRTASKLCYFLEKEKGIIVNREWLMTGKGEMIVEGYSAEQSAHADPIPSLAAEEDMFEAVDYREKYFDLLEEYSKLQREHCDLLKQVLAGK